METISQFGMCCISTASKSSNAKIAPKVSLKVGTCNKALVLVLKRQLLNAFYDLFIDDYGDYIAACTLESYKAISMQMLSARQI